MRFRQAVANGFGALCCYDFIVAFLQVSLVKADGIGVIVNDQNALGRLLGMLHQMTRSPSSPVCSHKRPPHPCARL
jgi:hypothetical protein